MNTSINSIPENINRSIANFFCNKGSVWGDQCLWYHSNWNLLRKLSLVSTPFWHEQFYINNIKNALENNSKILICGAADEAMCVVVLKAIQDVKKKLEIYMVDLCTTPLINSFIYSFSKGYIINIKNADAKKLPFTDNYFSLIVTDAFLTRFSRNERRIIVDNWYRVLKPDGLILTTCRINNSSKDLIVKSNFINSASFVIRALLRSFYSGLDPVYAGSSASQYVSKIDSRPITFSELKRLFRKFSGFKFNIPSGQFREVEQKQYARIKIIK